MVQEERDSDRRKFLKLASAGTLALAGASALSACSSSNDPKEVSLDPEPGVTLDVGSKPTPIAQTADQLPIVEWEMPTSWVESLKPLWNGMLAFAQNVSDLTSGRFIITPRQAGEVAGGLEVLPAVSDRRFPIGSTASYYYQELSPVVSFGTAVPFGLNNRQQMSWLHTGGGLELLQDHYARKFNLIQFPAGSTGAQMGGWYTKEINSAADLEGLRMRIPGLGAKVMSRLGVEPKSLGGGEILEAFTNGEIDAAEFIGPYDDTNLNLQSVAPYYYYPGFWEPDATLEVEINLDDWNELPAQYQAALRAAAIGVSVSTLAEYDARNGQALNDLVTNGTELRIFPDDVLQAAQAASGIVLDEIADTDAEFKAILDQWRAFRSQVKPWFSLAEAAVVQ